MRFLCALGWRVIDVICNTSFFTVAIVVRSASNINEIHLFLYLLQATFSVNSLLSASIILTHWSLMLGWPSLLRHLLQVGFGASCHRRLVSTSTATHMKNFIEGFLDTSSHLALVCWGYSIRWHHVQLLKLLMSFPGSNGAFAALPRLTLAGVAPTFTRTINVFHALSDLAQRS